MHGHSLLIDEINLEERGRYLKSMNSILGLCREHTHLVDPHATSIDAIAAVASALEAGTCHLGKEATVAVIGAFRYDNYGVSPVLISPTCKTETAQGSLSWLQMILTEWRNSPHGELKWGPIWSVASDGDATQRKAFHMFLLK